MKPTALILIPTLLLGSLSIQAQQVVKLWGDKHPAPHTFVLKSAENTDEHGFVRDIQEAELYIYPAKTNVHNSGKAVLLLPGGGYGGVSMRWEGTEFAELLAKNGISAMALKYRMPNGQHQIPMEDTQRALDMIRDNAASWGGYKVDSVGVAGFSAGGHLAAMLSVVSDPAFTILYYPVISAEPGKGHDYSFQILTGGDTTLMKYYSAEKHVTSKTPEALIFHGSKDNVVPLASSEAYREALIHNGVRVTSVIYNTSDHGWGMHPRFGESANMQHTLVNWILGL